jgi:hypothetical protein
VAGRKDSERVGQVKVKGRNGKIGKGEALKMAWEEECGHCECC